MAIFKIFKIFSAMSTFVLRSRVNILDSTRSKRFLSLSMLINLSNSSCTESEIDVKTLKIPSIESSSLLSLARYAYSSLVISSRMSTLLLSTQACGCLKSKRFSVDSLELLTNMLQYLF